MKIEILFPEFCNLYGDSSNMNYLRQCLKDEEFIETSMNDVPTFAENDVSLIYLGPMTEKMQEKVIEKLRPYTQRLQELINNNANFLLTGNAFEVFGKYIENEDGSKVDGLGLIDIYAKRDMFHRYNELTLGKFKEDIKIVGFKNQFTKAYGNNNEQYFLEVLKGSGLNNESKLEGIMINNFIGTYLLGPILILNPLFTKYLITSMGKEDSTLAFEEEAMIAYQKRLEDFESSKV